MVLGSSLKIPWWEIEDEVVCLGNLNRYSPRQVESKNAVLFYNLLCL